MLAQLLMPDREERLSLGDAIPIESEFSGPERDAIGCCDRSSNRWEVTRTAATQLPRFNSSTGDDHDRVRLHLLKVGKIDLTGSDHASSINRA